MNNNQIVSKQIIINNLLLNYFFVLQGKKPGNKNLVFLHGWGVDSQLWFKIIPKLAKQNYSLYFLDLPGFGLSQIPDITFGINDYKNIVCEFVKKLGLKKIILIGHSFGGSIAIKAASENPSFLDRLILVNAAGIRDRSKRKGLKSILSKAASPLFFPSFMQPLRIKLYQFIGSEYLNIPAMSKTFSKVVSEDLSPILTNIKKPTLIISGNKDRITPVSHAKFMGEKINGSKLEILSAGHFSFIDQPEDFVRELIKFI